MSLSNPESGLDRARAIRRTSRDRTCAPLASGWAMLALDKGTYYVVEHVAARVWELLETPRTPAEIYAALVAEFAVDPQTCEREVSGFLAQLLGEGLLEHA